MPVKAAGAGGSKNPGKDQAQSGAGLPGQTGTAGAAASGARPTHRPRKLSKILAQPPGTVVGLVKEMVRSVNASARDRRRQRMIRRKRAQLSAAKRAQLRRARRLKRIQRARAHRAGLRAPDAAAPNIALARANNTGVASTVLAQPVTREAVGTPSAARPSKQPVAAQAVQAADAKQVTPASVSGPVTNRRARRRGPRLAGVPRLRRRRSVVAGELIIANASRDLLASAGKLGLTVDAKPVVLSSGETLTRATFAKTRNADTVVGLLQNLFSSDQVYLNHRYSLYDVARGGGNAGWQTKIKSSPQARCTDKSCYAERTIGWNSALAQCAQGVRIGVIDTALDAKHAAFSRARIKSHRIHPGEVTSEAREHGTGIMSVLAARRSGSHPGGLLPDADYYHIDAFYVTADGELTSDTLSLVKALEDWGAHLINLSLVGPKDKLLQRTIAGLNQRGTILVAAVGNDGPSADTAYPAGYPTVIGVTAVDRRQRAYRYANRGKYVDLAAPGVNVWAAMPGQSEGLQSGTSFAVPFVTAIIASNYWGLRTSTRTSVVKTVATIDLGKPGRDDVYGRGLVRAPVRCIGRPDNPVALAGTAQPSLPEAASSWAATVPTTRKGIWQSAAFDRE